MHKTVVIGLLALVLGTGCGGIFDPDSCDKLTIAMLKKKMEKLLDERKEEAPPRMPRADEDEEVKVVFDVVLLKYKGPYLSMEANSRASKEHLDGKQRNRVITYPDSHRPILVPANRVKELKKMMGGEMLELSPEFK